MHIGLLGFGYWGKLLLSKLLKNTQIERVTVFNRSNDWSGGQENRDRVVFSSAESEVFANKDIRHIFIALTAALHYEFIKKGLTSGKHIFVEKPMTNSFEKAMELNILADMLGLTLMVDHTFLYTSQVRRIKEIVSSGDLGIINYYDSTRVALGNVQKDVNVSWDLAVHDLAMLDYLIQEKPVSVSAVACGFAFKEVISYARITLFYESAFTANIKVSWDFPEKVRDIFIGGTEKIIKYDDTLTDEKLKLYDCGYKFDDNNDILYKRNSYIVEDAGLGDALEGAIDDFIKCSESGLSPVSNGPKAAEYLNILEKIDISMKLNGQEVKI